MKKNTSVVALLAITAVFAGACSDQSQTEIRTIESSAIQEAANEEKQAFNNLVESYSYAYGVELAERFKKEGIELNIDLLEAAMQDTFNGNEVKMSQDEAYQTRQVYEEIHYKKKAEKRAAAGEINKIASAEFLAANAKKDGVVVTETGLQYKIMTEGTGDYKPTDYDEVTVHYRGKLIDGTEFDSTHQRDQAYTTKLKYLVEGWIEAMKMMTVGAKWELYIPADLAYGEEGSEEWVGPHAALIFEVELLDIKKQETEDQKKQ